MALKYVAGLLVLGLLASACSPSDDSETAGPEASTSVDAETTTVVSTTVVESLTGLETELNGEPPSTTVSTDTDEQTAAEVVHWRFQTYENCRANLATCDLNDFSDTSRGSALESPQGFFEGQRDRNEINLPDPVPSEFEVMWARRSVTNPDVIGVLHCERNHYVGVDEQGEVVDKSSPVGLFLNRVERTDDGTFLVVEFTLINKFQPGKDGGDECSTYDGTEVPDNPLNDYLQ